MQCQRISQIVATVLVLACACPLYALKAFPERWPQNIQDSKGNTWMIYPGGYLRQNSNTAHGTHQFYNQGAQILFNGSQVNASSQLQVDDKTGELIFENISIPNGLSLTRRILVNKEEGYVRYLDIIKNPRGQNQTVNLAVQSSFNYSISSTQSIEDPKRKSQNLAWVGQVQIGGDWNPVVLEVFGGKGAKTVPSFNWTPGNNFFQAQMQLSIPGGKEIALVHIHAVMPSSDAAVQFVNGMKESKILASVPQALRKLIVNFPGGQNWLGDYEILRGDLFDVVELRSGDQLRGTLKDPGFQVQCFYGVVDLPADRVIAMMNVGTYRPQQLLITAEGETFAGKLQSQSVKLELSNGQVTNIPMSQISRMGYRKRSGESEEVTLNRPMVMMRSGDRVAVVLPAEPIELNTRYGVLKMQPDSIAAIAFQVEEHGVHQVYLTDGSKFAALVRAQELQMKLVSSKEQTVKFPVGSIVRMQLAGQVDEVGDSTATVQLANDDLLVGTLVGQLQLDTGFDSITLNAGEIRRLAHPKGASPDVQISLWDETVVSGVLQQQELTCQLKSGSTIKIPIALLEEYSQPLPSPSSGMAEKIKTLIGELSAEDFKLRERAEAALISLGTVAIPQLKELRAAQNTEGQARIDTILKQLQKQVEKSKGPGSTP